MEEACGRGGGVVVITDKLVCELLLGAISYGSVEARGKENS